MTTEEKFQAAVNVIRSLPKNGSFQPSNELKLKFYSYYKQATEGPCTQAKPGFWDIVNKAKWEAWRSLGDMPKEEAMEKYVDEIKKIVETMSFSESVAQFMDVLGPFYELVPLDDGNRPVEVNGDSSMSDEDIEVVDSEGSIVTMTKAMNSLKKNDTDINRNTLSSESSNADLSAQISAHIPAIMNGHMNNTKGDDNTNNTSDADSDGDEFSDTYDHMNEDGDSNQYWAVFRAEKLDDGENDGSERNKNSAAGDNDEGSIHNLNPAISPAVKASGDDIVSLRGGGDRAVASSNRGSGNLGSGSNRAARSRQSRGDGGFFGSGGGFDSQGVGQGASGGGSQGGGVPRFSPVSPKDSNEQLALAVIRLQQSMEEALNRLDALEAQLQRQHRQQGLGVKGSGSWWSALGLSPQALILLLSWPFVVHWIMHILRNRRHH